MWSSAPMSRDLVVRRLCRRSGRIPLVTGRMKDGRRVRHAIGFTMLGMQVFEIVHTLMNPAMEFSIHRSLPLHFCGLNAILLGILCFRFNPHVFTFAGFLGMIGGFHSVLTPQLPSGDALPLFILFYLKHAALVVVPIAMARSFGAFFPKWAWIRAYGIAVALSTVVMGINALLNGPFAHPDGLVANYMYVGRFRRPTTRSSSIGRPVPGAVARGAAGPRDRGQRAVPPFPARFFRDRTLRWYGEGPGLRRRDDMHRTACPAAFFVLMLTVLMGTDPAAQKNCGCRLRAGPKERGRCRPGRRSCSGTDDFEAVVDQRAAWWSERPYENPARAELGHWLTHEHRVGPDGRSATPASGKSGLRGRKWCRRSAGPAG